MTPCPDHRNPYAHLIQHSPYVENKRLTRANIMVTHMCAAMYMRTPYILGSKARLDIYIPEFMNTAHSLRYALWSDRRLIWATAGDGFMVAPPEWPEELRRAWGLAEPPTPYEVACALLMVPWPRYWSLTFKESPRIYCGQSLLYWWLMGMDERIMAHIFSGQGGRPIEKGERRHHDYWLNRSISSLPSHEPDRRALREATTIHLGREGDNPLTSIRHLMAAFIRNSMTKPRFALWALSTNLVPACSDRKTAAVAAALMQGKTPGTGDPEIQKAQHKLVAHPYIRSQLAAGRATAPVARPLYRPGIVWQTLGEKREWEKTDPGGNRGLKSARVVLLKEGHHPEFVQLTI